MVLSIALQLLPCLEEIFGGSLWYTIALTGCLVLECGELPEQTESDLWDRDQHPNPQLMPLPSTSYDLDWNSLVRAAQEYESKYRSINEYVKIVQHAVVPNVFDTYKCKNAIALDVKYRIMCHVQTNHSKAFLSINFTFLTKPSVISGCAKFPSSYIYINL